MQVRVGYKVEGFEMMLLVNRISEVLIDVGQQKDVRKKIMVVVILHRFRIIVSPNFTSPIVILRRARFVFHGITRMRGSAIRFVRSQC